MSLFFKIVKEETNMICREMLNRQSFDWLSNLVCQERQKQDQEIAVTALGILPEIPISLQMFEQEPSSREVCGRWETGCALPRSS